MQMIFPGLLIARKNKMKLNSCTCQWMCGMGHYLAESFSFDVVWNRAIKEIALGDLRVIIKYAACACSPEMFFHHSCRKHYSQYSNKKKCWR